MKMMKLFVVFSVIFLNLSALNAQNITELKMPNSNKIVVKIMFRNGSISDPAGKEGLTQMTISLMTGGGAGDLSYGNIQDKLYPWAASYGASLDKEVSVFTFQVPADFEKDFYPIFYYQR